MQSVSFKNNWKPFLGDTFTIFNTAIHRLSFNESVDWVLRKAINVDEVNTHKTTCYFVNADCLNRAYADNSYRKILNKANRVFADGSGVRLACKIKQLPLPENINGTDMFPALCHVASKQYPKALKIYLLGGKSDVAKTMREKMTYQFPMVGFVGHHDGYFEKNDIDKIINEINQSDANLLLVGMGAPYQEKWINQHRQQLDVAVCMGVGGLFDYYSGNIPRAPLWMRNIGCEWMWRLLQEPIRLFKRYIFGNTLFVLRVFTENNKDKKVGQFMLNPIFVTKPSFKNDCIKPFKTIYNLLSIQYRQAEKHIQRIAKRSIDIVGASCGLILFSPVLLITMALIYLESPGSIFFSQQRVGKNGKLFKLWKFRSMYCDAEERFAALTGKNEMQGGVLFKIKQDPRITNIGKFIRKFSIDELPQLWNVLNGSMSLVGPRPALPEEVAQYEQKCRQRLLVKPGITCIWQVSGRSDIPFEQQVELDHLYISKRSLLTDIKLLLATVPAVITARGAY